MTEHNILPTNEDLSAEEKNKEAENSASRIGLIIFGAAIVVTAFYLFIAFQMNVWQMYALAGVIAVFTVATFAATRSIRAGNIKAGIWTIIIGMLIIFPAAALLISNIGLIFGLTTVILTVVVANQTLPSKEIRQALIASVIVGVVTAILDLVKLEHRLFVPEIQTFVPAITAVIVLLASFFFVRQAWSTYSYSISNRLTALVLIVTIPLLIGVTAYISNRAGNEIEAQALQALQDKDQSLATNVSTWLEMHVRSLNEMAMLPDITSMNATDQKPTLQIIASAHPNLFLVQTTDMNGLNVARNDDADLNDYSDRGWFLEAASGSPITYEALISRTIGKPALNMSTPIYNESGRIVGVASIVSELSEISREVLSDEGQGITYIVGANNRVVAHPDPSYTEGELRDLSTYPPVAALSDGETGQITFIDENGVSWVAYVDRLDNGWGIIAQQPEAELLLPVRQFQTVSIILIFIGSGVMFALAWFAIRRSLQPIGTLTTTVAAIAAGDLSRMAEVKSQDEVGVLASTFNDMTAKLRESFATLEQRVEERTSNLRLAAQIGQTVSQESDLDTMLTQAAQLILEQFDLYYVQVYLTDERQSLLKLKSGTGTVGAQLLEREHSLPISTASLNGRAAIEKYSVVIPDTAKSPAFRKNVLLPETRGEMAIPLIVQDRVVGVLDMQTSRPDELNEEVLPAFEALAGQLAVAIQNANLLEEAQQARADVEAQARRQIRSNWSSHLDAIHKPQKIGYLFDRNTVTSIADLAKDNLPMEGQALSAPIDLIGEELGSLVVELDESDQTDQNRELVKIVARQVAQQIENLRLLEEAERYRHESEEAAHRETREGWQQYIASRNQEGLMYSYNLNEVRARANEENDQEILTLPLRARDEEVGSLSIQGIASGDQDSVQFANTIAQRLGDHIENLRLSEQTQQSLAEVAEQTERLGHLNEFSEALAQSETLDDIYKTSATMLPYIVDAARFSMTHLAEGGEMLEIFALQGESGAIPTGTKLPITGTATGRCFAERRGVIDPDLNENTYIESALLAKQGLRSTLSVPLIVAGESIGTVNFANTRVRAYATRDQDLAVQAASLMASAIENRQQYQRAQKQADRETMLNTISQKIQSATSVEAVLQIAARELGHALGAPMTVAQLSIKDQKEND